MEYFKPSSERMIEALERARRHWHSRDAQASLDPLAPPAPPPFTIALSCEAGANGPAVARAVGDRLGWHVYDHELVELIAREMGVRADLLESLDEKRRSWLQEAFEAFVAGLPLSEVAYVARSRGRISGSA
jgi:hypothetical protein